MELPSDVRKLMGNDPAKLHEFLNNKENHELLVKRGILNETKVETKDGSQGAPPLKPEKGSKEPKDEPKGE